MYIYFELFLAAVWEEKQLIRYLVSLVVTRLAIRLVPIPKSNACRPDSAMLVVQIQPGP